MSGADLHAWRQRHGWTRPEAAQLLQVSAAALLKRERGEARIEPALALLCWLLDDPATLASVQAHVGFAPRPWGRMRESTRCPQGHPWTPENTYQRPDGLGRQCRACNATRERAREQQRPEPHASDHGPPRAFPPGGGAAPPVP